MRMKCIIGDRATGEPCDQDKHHKVNRVHSLVQVNRVHYLVQVNRVHYLVQQAATVHAWHVPVTQGKGKGHPWLPPTCGSRAYSRQLQAVRPWQGQAMSLRAPPCLGHITRHCYWPCKGVKDLLTQLSKQLSADQKVLRCRLSRSV